MKYVDWNVVLLLLRTLLELTTIMSLIRFTSRCRAVIVSNSQRSTQTGLHRSALFVLLVLAASALVGTSPENATAGCPVCTNSAAITRTQDQVWLISSRGVDCPDNVTSDVTLPTSQFDLTARQWQASDLNKFLAADDGHTRTVVFVHGNQTTAEEAQEIGLVLYRDLASDAKDDRPLHFVIWSWPSDRVGGTQLNDVRVKAPRADVAGYYLATVVNRMNSQTPTTMIGFSYGARAITGALQLEAGGQLCGWTLPKKQARAAANVALLGAAEDSDWLLPGQRNDQALSQTEHLLNVYNSSDHVLRFYHFIYGRRCNADALGYVGLSTGQLTAEQRAKVSQCDAGSTIGSEHSSNNYLRSPCLLAKMRPLVFEVPLQTAAKPAK